MVHDLSGDAFVDRVNTIRGSQRSFLLSPTQWRTYSMQQQLSWQFVKFEEANRVSVPDQRGVYAFVVRHDNGYFPPHGYIMYIGNTGAGESLNTLRARYGDYIQERKRNKRPAVHFMLNAYKDDLFFFFVPFADCNIDLDKIEEALNDAIVPPVNKKDFSAELRSVMGAMS